LTALGFNLQRLKVKYDEALSNLAFSIAFRFNLRPYVVGSEGPVSVVAGKPLQVEGFAFSGGGAAAQAVYLCLLPDVGRCILNSGLPQIDYDLTPG
jgi:hypothetical protein